MDLTEDKSVLVVDDEPQVREVLAAFLREHGMQVETAASGEEACGKLDIRKFDLVFTDLSMPGMGGLEVLRHIQTRHPQTPAIVMTAYGSLESAVEAMRAGALDYLTKPLSFDEIQEVLPRSFDRAARKRELPAPQRTGRSPRRNGRPRIIRKIIGASRAIRDLNTLIATVAASDSTVLIRGESGTGKELVADALHRQSTRKDKAIIPVNCGAIPEDLLESELFGHVRGSFTGAIADRVGRFVLANGGTIFLDEIGDMSPKLQVKVLRVLQEQELEPVGAADTVRVDVRVIAATNVDLELAVQNKRFREDLYYRLNVIPIEVPPLRSHIEDMPLLVEHFIRNFNETASRPLERFAGETLEVLTRYPWPGNVRELENLVERMSVLAAGPVVGVADLPEKFRGNLSLTATGFHHRTADTPACHTPAPASPPETGSTLPSPDNEGVGIDERTFLRGHTILTNGGTTSTVTAPAVDFSKGEVDLNELVEEYERRLILQALEKSDGVKSRAAEVLGIKRTTLVEKMKKRNIVYETT